jgi:hypothetical protein
VLDSWDQAIRYARRKPMQGVPVARRGRRGVEGHAKCEVSLRGVSREEPPVDGIRKGKQVMRGTNRTIHVVSRGALATGVRISAAPQVQSQVQIIQTAARLSPCTSLQVPLMAKKSKKKSRTSKLDAVAENMTDINLQIQALI